MKLLDIIDNWKNIQPDKAALSFLKDNGDVLKSYSYLVSLRSISVIQTLLHQLLSQDLSLITDRIATYLINGNGYLFTCDIYINACHLYMCNCTVPD